MATVREVIREHRTAFKSAVGIAECVHDLAQVKKIRPVPRPVPGQPERIVDAETIRRREANREAFLRQAQAWAKDNEGGTNAEPQPDQ